MARFSDKVVIITGAASGIGEATARRFAEEGARLVLCDLDGDNLARVATVAAVIAFLAGADAAYVTGVNLPVDGGLTASNGQPPLSRALPHTVKASPDNFLPPSF